MPRSAEGCDVGALAIQYVCPTERRSASPQQLHCCGRGTSVMASWLLALVHLQLCLLKLGVCACAVLRRNCSAQSYKWGNHFKEVYWRLVVYGLPTAQRMHHATCQCL